MTLTCSLIGLPRRRYASKHGGVMISQKRGLSYIKTF